jgi:hypothetical protein
MRECTGAAALFAMPPFCLLPLELLRQLRGPLLEVARLVCRFRQSEVTPQSACDFERRLLELLREVGRCIVEWAYNDCEPRARDLLPRRLQSAGVWYQRNDRKTANRHVATLFGKVTLTRFLYRAVEERVPCIFPLELRLGLERGRATAALAERVGWYAARDTQQAVLQTLLANHGVKWSVHLLRRVTAAVAEGVSGHRHEAQVAKLLGLLEAAYASRGDRQPVLAVGRDGIFTPVRNGNGKGKGKGNGKGKGSRRGKRGGACYREGAVATASVLDRRGKRLGSVYLGRMPEEGQRALSDQLTALIRDVLRQWAGPLPRLAYVTDGGHHQAEYYKKVLRRMPDPRTGRRLRWEWVLDYYHACQYVTRLAVALFGEGRDALAWAARMRRWLRDKPKGIHRVLHSAAALRHLRGLAGPASAFDGAYGYLSKRIAFLDYPGYGRLHLPIGSGVTEACCKTVFTQRLKQSGMSWDIESGQVIVDLRVVHLSRTWEATYEAYLRSKDVQTLPTQPGQRRQEHEKAA